MAPKLDTNDPQVARLIELFATISLTGQRAADTIKNPKYARALEHTITALQLDRQGLDAKTGSAVVVAASSGAELPEAKLDYIVQRVLKKDLVSTDQIQTACKYAASVDAIDDATFDSQCGVGVVITPDMCHNVVRNYMQSHHADICLLYTSPSPRD